MHGWSDEYHLQCICEPPENKQCNAVLSCCCLQGVTAQIKLGATGRDRLRHPYDLAPSQNVISILGDDPLVWLMPCQSTPGGLSYPTTFDKKTDYFSF
jgi:hypothetical protein